jgi:aspartate dehydrogenase
MSNRPDLRVAVAGLGAIGKVLASRLSKGDVEGCRLSAVSGRDPDKTETFLKTLERSVPNVDLEDLSGSADVSLLLRRERRSLSCQWEHC